MAEQKVVGIDLGTTNSVVCYRDKENADILISDDKKRKTHPSVVAINNKGELLFSYDAKNRADRAPAPVFFIKRQMGRPYKETLDREYTPTEVSAEILKYLISLTDKQLDEGIKRAIITVPAHFDLTARQATVDAGRLAGLEVEECLIEPVAAALAYGMESKNENSRILVYDLGGGTFDVTILEKRPDALESLGWAGDNMLGGSNFDKAIANHILKQIRKDYKLTIDIEKPELKAKWCYLLMLAENIKMKLSEYDQAEIRIRGDIKDDDGDTISIEELYISRDEFVDLIKTEIDNTMKLTKEALNKANVTKKDIDEIILVGGSTYIPYVLERLEKEFSEENGGKGQKPQQYKPDYCVAIGAAIRASYLDKKSESEKAKITLSEIPNVTSDIEFSISGKVDIKDSSIPANKCHIKIIRKDNGESQETNPNDEGGFFIDNIELAESFKNDFSLKLFDQEEQELSSIDFTVEQNLEKDDVKTDEEYLNKPIQVLTETGMTEILGAGKTIPATDTKSFKTTDKEWIIVKVFDGTLEIGEIPINTSEYKIPKDTALDITVNFSKNYDVDVKIEIPGYGITKKGIFKTFYKDAPSTKTVEELRGDFSVLRNNFEDCMNDNKWKHSEEMGNKKIDYEDTGEQLIDSIDTNLHTKDGAASEQAVIDPKDVEPKIMELKGLLDDIHLQLKGLTPPWDDFIKRVENAKDLIKEVSNTGKLEGEDSSLTEIEREGDKIYKANDKDRWAKINHELNELITKLNGKRPPIPESEVPETEFLKEGFIDLVKKTERAVKDSGVSHNKREEYLNSLDKAKEEIKKIPYDMDKMSALRKIYGIMEEYVKPVEDAITKGGTVCYQHNCGAPIKGDGKECSNGHVQPGYKG